MHCKRDKKETKHNLPLLAAVLLSLLFLGGCAGKYWNETLEEEESARILGIVAVMQEETRSCFNSLDADAFIFWKTPLAERAFAGYLQLLSPSLSKFVISNPLGQPVYVFSSNGKTFQSLNIQERRHIRGNIRAFALRNELPPVLLNSDWFAYLTGRLPGRPIQAQEVNYNASDQTVWLQFHPLNSSISAGKAYVHLHPEKREVLGYLFLDRKGKPLARIQYEEQQKDTGLCTLREEITVTDLPWGAELRIELKEINTDTQLQAKDFSLPVPQGYGTQLRP